MRNLFFLLVSVSLLFIGCKQKDTQPPLIILNGDNPMTVTLGSWWSDPGAIVEDNVDGSMVGKVVITHNIDINGPANGEGITKLAGTYTVTYTVKDKADNEATTTRIVCVKNSAEKYATRYETNINSDYLEQIVKDTIIASQEITFDTRVNHKAWMTRLGGKINTNISPMINTIRVAAYFISDSIQIPLQKFYIKELVNVDTISYFYQVRGKAGQCHISDTIDPTFVIKYQIDKYKISNVGQWDTLGHLWLRFKTDDVIESWERY
jgi:hypothetical protein